MFARLQPVVLLVVSEGQDVDAEKEKKLVVHGKKKASAKKVVTTPVQGSSSRDVEGLNQDEVYVPDWTVKVGDSFRYPNVCACNIRQNGIPKSDPF
ncbi:hypothetical protein Hanom_Chr13g01188011 [Helianthus anomalus]